MVTSDKAMIWLLCLTTCYQYIQAQAACTKFTYGATCQYSCHCDQNNTAYCDPLYGSCTCLPGWTSADCHVDIDECNTQNSKCDHGTCYNNAGSYTCDCINGFEEINGTCIQKKCSSILYNSTGEIKSPTYPDNYYDFTNCSWLLQVNEKDVVVIIFYTLVTECCCDFVKIYDGPNITSPLLGSYCTMPSGIILSSSNSMYITFTTDFSVVFRGFLASYMAVVKDCSKFTYGATCQYSCHCDQNNTAYCDPLYGSCTCLPGWTSADCHVDIDECNTQNSKCDHGTCYNNAGSYTCDCINGFEKINGTCIQKKCSSTLYNSTGELKSPNYPDNYYDFTNCSWLLQVNEKDVVVIIFHTLVTECCCDFVKIYDGPNITSPLLGSYCAIPSGIILSSSNSMYITFITDFSGVYRGFLASYMAVNCPADTYTSECSLVCNCVQENTKYCNRVNGICICKDGWTSSDCSEVINECLTHPCPDFSECINLYNRYDCRCYAGLYMSNNGKCKVQTNSTCSERNCSHQCATVERNNSFIETCYCPVGSVLQNNSCIACSNYTFGEKCQFKCGCVQDKTKYCDPVNGTCVCLSGWTSSNCSVDIKCNYVLTNSTGVIQSPNYPSPYFNFLDCAWLIQANQRGYIYLKFDDIFCWRDALNVYDGNNTTAPPIGQFCPSTDFVAIISFDYMLITFTSYNLYIPSRFSASYKLIITDVCFSQPCPDYSECRSLSDSYECQCYQGLHMVNNSKCEVVNSSLCLESNCSDQCVSMKQNNSAIDACYCPVGSVLQNYSCIACSNFTFGEKCLFPCACIQDRTEYCDPVNGTCKCLPGWTSKSCSKDLDECSQSPPICGVYASCINSVGSYHCNCFPGIGRAPNGTCIKEECHFIMTNLTGLIKSPNFPGIYYNGASCSWLIQSIENQLISLKFDTLSTNCVGDLVIVYDGNDTTAPQLGRYCSLPINTTISSTNNLFITFTSNWYQTKQGFHAIYESFNNCKFFFTNLSGEIKSPKYPLNYYNLADCSWLIKTNENFVISLKFQMLTTECGYDFVTIYDGNNAAAALIGRYCNLTTDVIISSNNSMFITFTSDAVMTFPGFLASYMSVTNTPAVSETTASIFTVIFTELTTVPSTTNNEFTESTMSVNTKVSDELIVANSSTIFSKSPSFITTTASKSTTTPSNITATVSSNAITPTAKNESTSYFTTNITDSSTTVQPTAASELTSSNSFTVTTTSMTDTTSAVRSSVNITDSLTLTTVTAKSHTTITTPSVTPYTLTSFVSYTSPTTNNALTTEAVEKTTTATNSATPFKSQFLQKDLYYYGPNYDDETVEKEFGAHSRRILFSTGVPFGFTVQKFAYVSINGAITFGEPHLALTPNIKHAQSEFQNIYCPFWSEVDPFYYSSNIYYHLYEKVRTKGNNFDSPQKEIILNRATEEVIMYYPYETDTFKASTVLIVTWERVKPYAWYSTSCRNSNYSTTSSIYCGDQTEVNTFQVIIVSNGTTTYAITMYQKDQMKWEFVPNRVIFVGYLSDNKLTDFGLLYSKRTINLDRDIGTAGFEGTYIDFIGASANSAQRCADFYYSNQQFVNNTKFQEDIKSLLPCPCNLERMSYQWTLVEKRNSDTIYCYALSSIFLKTELSNNSLNKLCCYQYKRASDNSWQEPQKVTSESFYFTGTPDSGNILTENPFSENRRLSLEHDILPKQWCCQDSEKDLCDLYNAVRPETECSLKSPFVFASSYGDPHITTLDGKLYTLNGWAEYIMILIPDEKFMLQSRTDRAETSNGKVFNATVFVAFAADEDNGASKLQVELSLKKTSMIIVADGIDYTKDFYAFTDFQPKLKKFIILREDSGNKTKLVASFKSGIILKIFVGIRSLELIVLADSKLHGKTQGLMGNYDGDPNNDFILPNGTQLLPNQTDKEKKIFFNFGKAWEVTENNTVFKYNELDNAATYKHSDFIPLFLEEVSTAYLTAAKSKCGSDNDACIYDYLATGDDEFARNTNKTNMESKEAVQSLNNNLPVLTVTQILNNQSQWDVASDTVNSIRVIATDADKDKVLYSFVSKYNGLNVSNDGVITFIPHNENAVVIQVLATDDKGGQSNTITISTAVCPNCNNHGDCDKGISVKTSGTFSMYACACYPAYTGAFCTENFNACTTNPCAVGQNCTDLTPEQQGMNKTGYICGPCPAGFLLQGDKCADINECISNQTCPQNCVNTFGSYICSCFNGYRINTVNNRGCEDINECEENIDDCSQICENGPGNFLCKCFMGYYMEKGSCILNTTNEDICKSKNCSQLCFVENNIASCDCSAGFALDKDGKSCLNIDECSLAKNPCNQICIDTIGKFNCSCYAGFKLMFDKISCTECETSFYGINCNKSCQCSGHGRCDSVRGCVCDKGWEGINCNTDIDECKQKLDDCTTGEICVNTMGGFSCNCPVGYLRNTTCQDINECADQMINNCNILKEDCMNIMGSYVCNCKIGFARNMRGYCEDIDECYLGQHSCQQICVNVPGQYNCACRYGYKLNDDRLSCFQAKDVCKDFEKLNCSQGCTVDLQQNRAYCFCQDGYRLVSKELCEDINECEITSLNLCSYSAGCINRQPGYSCSCPPGSKMDNNGRTCINCSGTTWGVNCTLSCSCSTGASRCDSVKGCICNTGYTGVHCEIDINQCANGEVTCKDNQQCVNYPGPDYCECKTGYVQTNNSCIDIDECLDSALNDCQQSCTNLIGLYTCACWKGYTYNTISNSCNDINECESKIDRCSDVCINTPGNYRCSCKPGYVLNRDGYSCDVTSVCSNSSVCQYNCINIDGIDTCFCPKGNVLNYDNKTCSDVDLCRNSPCSDLCAETADNTSIVCSCFTGRVLTADSMTCQACLNGRWGDNCNNICTCFPATTESCNPVNGSCHCQSGCIGTNCSHDVDECFNNQTICHSHNNTHCVNTNGGYLCVCNLGFGRTTSNDECQECLEYFYGKDCSQQCNCNRFHSACDKINGTCQCYKGWAGPTCDEDINECNNGSSCSNEKYEQCINIPGSFHCSCQPGYYRQNSIEQCDVCPLFYYGDFCSQSCACNSSNADNCNNINGTCSCTAQWQGINCSTDVDECKNNLYICPINSICTNLIGGYKCTCNTGFFFNSTAIECQKILGCSESHVDVNCTYKCNCNMSNSVCNTTNGSCKCYSGWTGSTCNDDINECNNTSICNLLKNEICFNTPGSYYCECPAGYILEATLDKCIEVIELQLQFKVSYETGDINFTDIKDKKYQDLKNETEQVVFNFFKTMIKTLRKVLVTSLRKGSLVVDCYLIFEETLDLNLFVQAVKYFVNQNLVIGSQMVYVQSVKLNKWTVDNSTSLCEMRNSIKNCSTDQFCEERNGTVICNSSTKSNDTLKYGLAVGIPVFFVLCVIIIITVICIRKRKQRKFTLVNESHDVHSRRPPENSTLYTEYQTYSNLNDSTVEKNKDDDQDIFYLKFLYQTVGTAEEFKIPRPKLRKEIKEN